jgi:hypothetical protein
MDLAESLPSGGHSFGCQGWTDRVAIAGTVEDGHRVVSTDRNQWTHTISTTLADNEALTSRPGLLD